MADARAEISDQHSLLMFSGGRDSTLAAIRTAKSGSRLVLATITSNHLWGIDRVKERLAELATVLPLDTRWFLARQPVELRTDTSFYEQTCLSCHHAYVVVGAFLAAKLGYSEIGFGYAGYQSTWPEQTSLAITSLRRSLIARGIDLSVPVYDLQSKEEAQAILSAAGMSVHSLEQKCIRQVTNVELTPSKLIEQIALWENAISSSFGKLSEIQVDILEERTLRDFR